MFFREPKIDFIELQLSNIITDSGAATSVCQKIGGSSMSKESFCSEWGGYGYDPNMPWELICSMVEDDPSVSH